MSEATTSSLGHVPADERWAFDESVTQVFDDMLQRSIPAYASMRDLTTELAAAHMRPGWFVVDLGCSRGAAIAPLVAMNAHVRFLACDVSRPMLAACRERFASEPNVTVQEFDLRSGFPAKLESATVVLSVLTLQFTPIEHRLRILRDARRALRPGGALLLVEKVIGATADIDEMFIEKYYAFKRANGYTQEEIDRKRLSLEGVLVPLPARWNEEALRAAGFSEVDCYWRWANFAAWIAR